MNLFARIRTWAGHKLLGIEAHDHGELTPEGMRPLSDMHIGALNCVDASNGRMVIVYECDGGGSYVRKFGMDHEQMLMRLRSSADQIDMATAARSTKH